MWVWESRIKLSRGFHLLRHMWANYNGGGGVVCGGERGALPRRRIVKRHRLRQHICSPAIRPPHVLQRLSPRHTINFSLSPANVSARQTRRRPPRGGRKCDLPWNGAGERYRLSPLFGWRIKWSDGQWKNLAAVINLWPPPAGQFKIYLESHVSGTLKANIT